ncbi:MAG: hypothetical protein R3250_08440 [Melioribacteraceae bacterium]|nr:hypothetical protein [Melioribacteraceae bacterium]
MSKKKSKKNIKIEPEKKEMFGLSIKNQIWIFLGLLLVILTILNKPTAIDGLSPQGTDVVAGVGKYNIVREFAAETGETALWNPAIFAGMPRYNDIGPKAFSVDNLFLQFQKFLGNIYIYYLFAAFGMFFLLRYLKMPPLIAFIGALMFVLLPHYKGLWVEGHFRKFRALMYLPWVIYAFKYFADKKSVLAAALFALAFGVQIRTGHYQIIFYTAILIFAIGLYPFIRMLIEKQTVHFLKSTGLLILALFLALAMSAQPLLLNKEYLPYSKRGKTTISLTDKDKVKTTSGADGVSIEYATQWSTHPMELMRTILPHAYGGVDGQKYTGKDYPQLKNQRLPNYWGYMPFHTMVDYIGIITVILAFIGLVMLRRQPMIISLGIFSLFLIFLSFGKHFEIFYSLFFNYFPFFNKFRAPTMSITVTSFTIILLAAYGLNYLFSLKDSKLDIQKVKPVYAVIGVFAFLGILIWLISSGLDYVKPGESYNAQVKEMLANIRKEYLLNDLLKYGIIIVLFSGFIWGYFTKKITFTALGIVAALIISIDLISAQSLYGEDLTKKTDLEKIAFQPDQVTNYLDNDKSLHRIFPVGQLLNDNRWGFNYHTIGGYSAIKMYAIEELVQNCYYGSPNKNFPINLNIAKFLNVKYLVLQQQIANPDLILRAADENRKLYLYEFKDHLQRGFFVGKTKVISDEYKRLEMINSLEFDASDTAILEEELEEQIEIPDSSFVKVIDYNPNRFTMDVFTDKNSLFVISEPYYPPGWKIYVNGEIAEKVYRTDHAIQSIYLKSGKHKIEMVFHPDSYYMYKNVAWASVSFIYIIILVSLFISYRKN